MRNVDLGISNDEVVLVRIVVCFFDGSSVSPSVAGESSESHSVALIPLPYPADEETWQTKRARRLSRGAPTVIFVEERAVGSRCESRGAEVL
jgi:hypothetical protein